MPILLSVSHMGMGMQAAAENILIPHLQETPTHDYITTTDDLIGFDHSPFPMCIIAEDSLAFLAVNEAAIQLYGYSREEFSHISLRDIRPHDSPEVLFAELDAVRNSKAPVWYSRVTSHRRKDGTMIAVQVTRSRIHFANRAAYLCSAENVTERIQNAPDNPIFFDNQARVRERAAELWAATLELSFKIAQQRKLERRNTAFLKLGYSLSTATTAYDAAKIISEVSLELFGWDAYTLDLFSTETNETVPVLYCDTLDGKRQEVPVTQSPERLTQRALRIISQKGELILKSSEAARRADGAFFGDMMRSSASLMFVPIESRGRPIGTLSVQSYRLNAYTQDDLQTLRALADHCAGALERVSAEQALRKFEERNTTLLTTSNLRLQFEINRRYRLEKRNEAFSKLGRLLSAVRTVRDAATTIGSIADELLGWDTCNFQLYTPETNKVTRILNVDTIDGERRDVTPDKGCSLTPILLKVLEEGPQLILRQEPVTFSHDTRPYGDVNRPSASLMFVPVRQRDVVKGFLSIQSYTLNAYTADDLRTLLVLADHCVGALERIWMEEALLQSEAQKNAMLSAANIKLQNEIKERHRLEKELLETADNERRRIGQDLHDDLGQQLTGINLLSQGLAMQLAKNKLRSEAAEAARIRRLTAQTLERARSLAHGLANFQFNDKDVVASLENLADRTKRYLKTSCSVKVTGKPTQLDPEVVRQLHSITLEAITNAVKHGRARKVDLQLAFSRTKIVLTIKNNGRRFNARPKDTPGLGLRIMQYRASVIGATLQFRAAAARGAVLTCTLPREGNSDGKD